MVGAEGLVRKPSLPSKKLVITATCRLPSVVRKSSQKRSLEPTEHNFEASVRSANSGQPGNGAFSAREWRPDFLLFWGRGFIF